MLSLKLWSKLTSRPSPKRKAEDDLNDTEMDILRAEQQQDYWNAIVPMLHARKARLVAQTHYSLVPELQIIRPKARKSA